MLIDLTGQKFGKLTVVKRVREDSRYVYWECVCDCNKNNIKIVRGSHLKSGRIKSCGCLYRNRNRKRSEIPPNIFIFRDDYKVGITDKDEEFYYDIKYSEIVELYNWYFDKDGYVVTTINKKAKKLHKLITNTNSKTIIDHKNKLKYDNRENNLRICTNSQNIMNVGLRKNNTTGHTGIKWDYCRNMWIARINFNKKEIYLGSFKNKEDAIKARKEAEIKYYGEFAPQLIKSLDK